jgi:hypothetical protein
MADTLTTYDDPTTATLMEAINEARILLASDAHRKDLAEMAKISTELIRLDERRTQLQVTIDERNKVYLSAEEALGAHLATKHRVTPQSTENAVSGDPEAIVRVRARPSADHASNCAVYFDEECDCQ